MAITTPSPDVVALKDGGFFVAWDDNNAASTDFS
jgi:hypothetical protein